jgi:GABA(A) receptor-associated protein
MLYEYKKIKTLDERKNESQKMLSKYYNYIPIVVEKCDLKSEDIDKKKYLVPFDFTLGQFLYILRKHIKLSPEKAMFCYINNNIPNISKNINTLYDDYKDEDGFLYVHYSTNESVFG